MLPLCKLTIFQSYYIMFAIIYNGFFWWDSKTYLTYANLTGFYSNDCRSWLVSDMAKNIAMEFSQYWV